MFLEMAMFQKLVILFSFTMLRLEESLTQVL